MLKTGLCSVTFRKFSAEKIVELAAKAGLEGIEWGGDVHVPPGNFIRAAEVGKMTRGAGLEVVSYGSYYRVGCGDENEAAFETVLETAVQMKAPAIRVWAGNRGSDEADEEDWERVVIDSKRMASLAEMKGLSVNYEYHGGTLTDTKESALRLMKEVNHHRLGIYWQPAVGQDIRSRLASIQDIRRWLAHVHVFHWDQKQNRLPLVEGVAEWEHYLSLLMDTKFDRYVMLEFVKEDNPEQFLQDAKVLKELVQEQTR